MHVIKKVLFWLVGLIATVAVAIVGIQVFYVLTPVVLSPETVALNERAARLPAVTENGYRLYGLLAPKDVDPVRYGRCLADAWNSQLKASPPSTDKTASDAYWKAINDRAETSSRDCAQGGAYISLPKAIADMRIKPGVTAAQWQSLATTAPDPLVVARAEAVWAGEARRLGIDIESPLPPFQSLVQLERWRTARAVLAWDSDQRAQAVAAWTRSINDWTKSADGSLIEAMISTATLSQIMLGMQDEVARSERIDDAIAEAAFAALAPIERMPQAVAESMLMEWLMTSRMMKTLPTAPPLTQMAGQGEPGFFMRTMERGAKLTFDVNDTLNRVAAANLQNQQVVLSGARGEPVALIEWPSLTQACNTLGDWEYLCLPFVRNPVGRIVVAISAPMYRDYGVRVAELRNLAAATRLTIEARRRGLSGEALTRFIGAAPADMRDVFSRQPFVYDQTAKHLRIELRQRSTVLGEKSYELAL